MTESDSSFPSFGLREDPERDECADLIGQTIDGRYTLEAKLGEGGFGCVFLAHQKSPNRQVAVKVQKRVGRESHRMAKEADLLGRFEDRGIARVFEAGDWASPTGSRVFVAMELIAEGRPLHHYCKENGLSVPARLSLFREVCRAVAVAHREGIIHRDLKPGNIIVDKNGQPRVIDFGISKVIVSEPDTSDELPTPDHNVATNLTRVGTFLGTRPYAAPEQRDSLATLRSDVHALGVILENDLFVGLAVETPKPKWIESLVARCTRNNPNDRYADAGELLDELDRLVNTRRPRPRWMIQAAAIAAVVVVAAAVSRLGGPVDSPPTRPLEVAVLDEALAVASDPAMSRLAIAVGRDITVSSTSAIDRPEHRLSVGPGGARRIAFDSSGAILAASDAGGWKAWDVTSLDRSTWPIFNVRAETPLSPHDGLIEISADGGTLFAQDGPSGLVAYDTQTAKRRDRVILEDTDQEIRLTAMVRAATADAVFLGLSDGSVRRWIIPAGVIDTVGHPHDPGVVQLAANTTGSRVAACGKNGRVIILDGRTAAIRAVAEPISDIVTAMCFVETDDLVVATWPPKGEKTTIIRLANHAGRRLVVSGSTTLPRLVTAMAFTGFSTVAVSNDPGISGADKFVWPLSNAVTITSVARPPSLR